VCSPALLRQKSLKRPADLRDHILLHFDYPGAVRSFMDWGTWLTALGIGKLRSAGALHFTQYEQMIQAAINGQGVALGRHPLVKDLIESGALVAPFSSTLGGSRAYFLLVSPAANGKPHVRQFADWLVREAKAESEGGSKR
jgi:LysR family glycine cleavage system transcriptional activator